jgi:hypothetical protein
MEHRWGQRFEVAFEVRLHLRSPYAPRRGSMVNISASGAFIGTNVAIPLLSWIQVELLIPVEVGQSPVLLPACVVRRTRKGIGVEWCEAESLVVANLVEKHVNPDPVSSRAQLLRLEAPVTISPAGIALMENSELTSVRTSGTV